MAKYHFSKTSQRHLITLHPNLQQICERTLDRWDTKVLEGYRSLERQRQLFEQGFSKVLNGKHNTHPSQAVDMIPCPVDWDDIDRLHRFGEYVLGIAAGLGVALRWGGDWDSDADLEDQTFNDLCHFELCSTSTGG